MKAIPYAPHIAVAVTVAAVAALGIGVVRSTASYDASVVLDNATNVVKGAPVRVDGFEAGEIKDIQVENGKAKVTFALEREFAPLHDGAKAVVGWRAALSERQLEITDGTGKGAEIPDGGMLRATQAAPVEVSAVLAALDKPTRKALQSTLTRLADTLEGAEPDTRATLKTAGPALKEVGSLLAAIGTDGPAIRSLVTQLDALMAVVAKHDGDLKELVTGLAKLTDAVAAERKQLRSTLDQLPSTLNTAKGTLDQVPATVDSVNPLLDDLKPATRQLGPVAADLKPVMRDLRPLVQELRPTLAATSSVLGKTPSLAADVNSTLPPLTSLVGSAQEPVAFLRPYTPEVTGFFSTWASAFANYDANGNYARIETHGGGTSLNGNPGVLPPGLTSDPYPKPGAIVDKAWTDADGSTIR